MKHKKKSLTQFVVLVINTRVMTCSNYGMKSRKHELKCCCGKVSTLL